MGVQVIQSFMFFMLCPLLISDSSSAVKEGIRQIRKMDHEQPLIIYPPSVSDTQLDTIPIVNPTTPTTGTPIVIPESPAPPFTTTTPITTTPTTPTPTTPATSSSSGAWCVASQSASETALQVALDYACGYGGADCSPVQPGASCYNPNTLRDHASYAFNDYYQKNPLPTSCAFGGTATLTYTDPSSGNCRYPSTGTSISPPTPTTTTPTTVTPSPPAPSTMSPVNPYYTPSTPTIYGSEPTESPSSANLLSYNIWLLITIFMLSVLAAFHL